ncbi:MAG: hypothetical protein Q8876_10110 [Bacillota bacterium]|nr:hypothetical protein [Bacillota bacterium]
MKKRGFMIILSFIIFLMGCQSNQAATSELNAEMVVPHFSFDTNAGNWEVKFLAVLNGKVTYVNNIGLIIQTYNGGYNVSLKFANIKDTSFIESQRTLNDYCEQQNVAAHLKEDFSQDKNPLKGLLFYDAVYYVILNDNQSTVYTYSSDIIAKYPQYAKGKGKGVSYTQFIQDVLNGNLYRCVTSRIIYAPSN